MYNSEDVFVSQKRGATINSQLKELAAARNWFTNGSLKRSKIDSINNVKITIDSEIVDEAFAWREQTDAKLTGGKKFRTAGEMSACPSKPVKKDKTMTFGLKVRS